jgi:dephospho-CoA kinase
MAPTRRIIGLTGGIATGKSTVTDYLHDIHQICVLDADRYAREAVHPPSSILNQIFQHFGKAVQTASGTLDRGQLAEIIFGDPAQRQWLEAQIHPFVRHCFEIALEQNRDRMVVLSIPLLFEAQMTDLVTEIWVVTCPLAMQINRLRQRNQLSQAQTIARIQSQAPLSEKIALADRIIDNNGTLAQLYQQVDRAIA